MASDIVSAARLAGSGSLAAFEALCNKHGVTKAELFGFGLQVDAAGTVAEFLRARGEIEEENHGQGCSRPNRLRRRRGERPAGHPGDWS